MMKFRMCAIALFSLTILAPGCQTPNRGTSTVETSNESTEPVPQEHEQQDSQAKAEAERRANEAKRAALEQNVDRPGSTYREVALDEADPLACKEICEKQMRCMSFTYVHPDDEGGPRCQLKHSIADKVEDQDCCVSGINSRAERRIAELEAEGYEFDTNRPGNDFRSFPLDRANASVCKEACDNLKDCVAFTYVRPGHEGNRAQCHLKDQVGEPVTDQDCCISGLK